MSSSSFSHSEIPPELLSLVSRSLPASQLSALDPLIQALFACYGESVQALVFYGSCLREGDVTDGLVDAYVVVDSYRRAYRRPLLSLLNALLPPNVFYLALPEEQGGLRAKYAVLSMDDFQKATSMRWFHSYFWGRFCQPTYVPYVRCGQVGEQIHRALGQAVVTFLRRVLPMLPPECETKTIWQIGLSLSYRAELRAERPGTIVQLYERSADYFEQVTRAAMAAMPFPVARDLSSGTYRLAIPSKVRWFCRVGWAVRKIQGKLLSLLRLIKGLLTFKGGVDYILWKIQRHSGITVEVTPRLRRYPLLAGWVVFWRLYRKGAFR